MVQSAWDRESNSVVTPRTNTYCQAVFDAHEPWGIVRLVTIDRLDPLGPYRDVIKNY